MIRDGIITAVGATVSAPGDARIIDGSGLTVYPGLIDSYTALGLGETGGAAAGGRGGRGGAAAGGAAVARVAILSNSPPGLQPENSAVELLRNDAEGFCILHGEHRVEISPLLSEESRRFRDYLRHSPSRRDQHHHPREHHPHPLGRRSLLSHVPPSNDVKHPPASPSHLR